MPRILDNIDQERLRGFYEALAARNSALVIF